MMKRPTFVAVAMLVCLCGAAPSASRTPAVSIVALYRERMMLPEGATLNVRLTDANSRHVIASAMLDNPHVPVHIALSYERSNIDAAHVYTVAARILVNGEPFFATDMPVSVITQNNPSDVEIVLKRVTPESPAFIEERRWLLFELNGHAVTAERPPFLELNAGLASGSGGCNRLSGGYTLRGDAIEFKPAATTMMACVSQSVTETESAFFKGLSNVRSWKAEQSELQLLDGNHKILMRFHAEQPD